MKTLLTLSALVLASIFSTPAQAMSPVQEQQIVIDPASRAAVRPIVEMTIGSGMAYPARVTTLVVNEDGSVERTMKTLMAGGEWATVKEDSLWYFEMDVVAKMTAAAARLQNPGKLVDQNPKDPKYADGLFISVSVVHGDKKRLVASSSGGHNYLPMTNSTQTRAARYLLNNMNNLFRSIEK